MVHNWVPRVEGTNWDHWAYVLFFSQQQASALEQHSIEWNGIFIFYDFTMMNPRASRDRRMPCSLQGVHPAISLLTFPQCSLDASQANRLLDGDPTDFTARYRIDLTFFRPVPVLAGPAWPVTSAALQLIFQRGGLLSGLELLGTSPGEVSPRPLCELRYELHSLVHTSQLIRLSIQETQLGRLPDSIRTLKLLEDLDLSWAGLDELPDWIGELVSLSSLTLYHNNLKALPNSFARLTSLTTLSPGRNPLSTFPSVITELTRLRLLDLGNCPMTHLPAELSQLHQLASLTLPALITRPPPSLVLNGSSQVRSFFADHFQSPEERQRKEQERERQSRNPGFLQKEARGSPESGRGNKTGEIEQFRSHGW